MDAADDDSSVAAEEVRIEGDVKIVSRRSRGPDGKVVITKTHFQMIKVSKAVAARRRWKKFGQAANDGDRPNVSNTQLQGEVKMDFLTNDNTDTYSVIDEVSKSLAIKCRCCDQEGHWSAQCPFKDKFKSKLEPSKEMESVSTSVGRYRDDVNTVRVSNLPLDITKEDLYELFKPFGPVSHIWLAQDKITQKMRGFAFVAYLFKEDAAKAIATVHGHGYGNMILSVEWAKSSGKS